MDVTVKVLVEIVSLLCNFGLDLTDCVVSVAEIVQSDFFLTF